LVRSCAGSLVAIAIAAHMLIATHASAQIDANSAAVYYPSCLAAAELAQGKRPAADSEDAAKQLRQAAICNGALTAIMNVEAYFKPEYAMCGPDGSKIAFPQVVLTVTAYLKGHPERLQENFHQVAVAALAQAWPCTK
jgi:hypothetical protein